MKKVLFWILAIFITLGASVYQRMTGPTNPKYEVVNIAGEEFKFKLPRSGAETDCEVVLNGFGVHNGVDTVRGVEYEATMYWRKYPGGGEYTAVQMVPGEKGFTALLPVQPAAGKLEYYIELHTARKEADSILKSKTMVCYNEPLIIRFKSNVPAWALIPHILCMFISMLFGAYALLCALANMSQYKKYALLSLCLLAVGGFIFGPIVQKFAFDVSWSGFPFGGDLTDNKTLIAGLVLLFAVVTRKKEWNRWAVVIAMLVMFIVFSIPHSMRGSELNHETGKIESGK